MSDSLVLVDSAEKAEVCKKYFANKAEVVVSLLPVALPVHRKTGKKGEGAFFFTGQAGCQAILDTLQGYLEKEIYLVFDSDARSQYLAWLISSYVAQMSKGKAEAKFISPLGLTHKELDKAMLYVNIADEKKGFDFYVRALFDAYLAKHLKRLIGTNKGPGNLPLNYAALTTMFHLLNREAEINTFVSQPKWQVEAKMRLNGQFFTATLLASYDVMADGSVKSEGEAKHLVTLIQDDDFVVEVVRREELMIFPPAPYLLAELLHDALVLKVQPKVVLSAVRRLSHGVNVDGASVALISTVFSIKRDGSTGFEKDLRAEVAAQFGEEFVGDANLQLAPGMICPLDPHLSADVLQGVLSEDEVFVYNLIHSRALASQMQAASGEFLRVEIAAGPESIFRVNFRVVQNHGFLQTYKGNYDKELLSPCAFADISEGQSLDLIKIAASKALSVPAEKYSVESLFVDLADFSIGAEPAAIVMLQAMFDNDYITFEGDGFLSPGPKAAQVTSIIDKVFPRMGGINLSAYIEQTMEEAVSGRKDLDFALKQFEQVIMLQGKSLVKVKMPSQVRSRKRSSEYIIKQSADAVPPAEAGASVSSSPVISQPAVAESVDDAAEVIGDTLDIANSVDKQKASAEIVDSFSSNEVEIEPDAQGEGVEALPEAGETVAVASEPLVIDDTAFVDGEGEWPVELKKAFEQALSETLPEAESDQGVPPPGQVDVIEALESEQDKQCSACGKPLLLKKDRFGKFWSCSAFPACRHTESFAEDETVKMSCPVCMEGDIIVKRTPTGKDFYVCLEDDCDFIAWSRPHYIQCMACDSSYLVEKKSLSGVLTLRCPKAGCDYSRPLSDDATQPAPKKRKVRVRRVKKGASVAQAGTGKKKVRVVRRRK